MDARLRALEAAAARGDVDARAALLRERVRAGWLDPERVRLAAYLGDPAARDAGGGPEPSVPGAVDAWVEGLARWGAEPGRPTEAEARAQTCLHLAALASSDWRHQGLARAALAIARHVRVHAPIGFPHQAQVAPERVPELATACDRLLAVADAWLASPSHTAARAARDAAQAAPHAGLPGLLATLAARHCSPPMPIHTIKDVRALTGVGLKEAKDLVDRPGGVAGAMALVAAKATTEDGLRAAIGEALVAWALEGDAPPP